jgi:ATP-dependent DNA helicase RecG
MLTVLEHRQPAGRGPFRVIAQDSAGNHVAITYFGRPIPPRRPAGGRDPLGRRAARPVRPDLQIVHPDHVSEDSGALMGHLVEAVYPCPKG